MKIGTFIISSALAFIILFNSISVSLTYAYYYLDPIDFIERLCENKDKPELQCNGKCQLKKVNEDYQSDTDEPLTNFTFKRISPFLIYRSEFNLRITTNQKSPIIGHRDLYAYQKEFEIFHPPQS